MVCQECARTDCVVQGAPQALSFKARCWDVRLDGVIWRELEFGVLGELALELWSIGRKITCEGIIHPSFLNLICRGVPGRGRCNISYQLPKLSTRQATIRVLQNQSVSSVPSPNDIQKSFQQNDRQTIAGCFASRARIVESGSSAVINSARNANS